MVYIYYYIKVYFERYLKITVEILENQFFIWKNIHSIQKDTLKYWDLQHPKVIILFISHFVKV